MANEPTIPTSGGREVDAVGQVDEEELGVRARTPNSTAFVRSRTMSG